MRYIGALGLIFALVLGLLGLLQVESLQDSLVAATSGPLANFVGLLSTFWLFILGTIVVLILAGIAIAVLR